MAQAWQFGSQNDLWQTDLWQTRRWMSFGLCLALLLCLLVPMANAQDEPQGPVERWQAALTELNDLAAKARTLPAGEQAAFHAEMNEKLASLHALRKEIEPQILQLVQDSTEISQPLEDTLLQFARFSISEDNFHRGFQLLKPLIDGGTDDPIVYQFAALAAFGSDRFELAQEWLNKIQADGGEIRIEFLRRNLAEMGQRIEDWKQEEAIRAAEAEKDDLPRVKFETTAGDIIIELYEDQAPNTVANFISLVEKGYYDGLTFHRVLPQFMAQGGCPDGTGGGGPGYSIPCECHEPNKFRKHFSGTLSMAHAGLNTGGSQFFLTFLATPHLDGRHTAFGRVLEGMDAVAGLSKIDPERASPDMEPSKIIKATVVRKREHEYKPKTLPATR